MGISDESRFIVFYTGRSPRMAYPQVIQLTKAIDKFEFIECCEGNNGLDFQLVSYLGYELHADSTKEMIIVSNDTGFDAVVLFWQERGMNINRIPRPNNSNSQSVGVTENVNGIDKSELYTIINCIGAEKSSDVHLAFVHFYGNKNGETIYKYMKSEKFAMPPVQWSKETKMKKLIGLIMIHSSMANLNYPDSFSDFIISNVVDDKSAMSNKINKEYGAQGPQFHKVFKPFYKTLVKIKKK